MFGRRKKFETLQKRAAELEEAMGRRPTLAELAQLKEVLEEFTEVSWTAHKFLATLYGKSIWVALDYGETDVELASPEKKAEILNYATLGLLQLQIFTETEGKKFDRDTEADVERYRQEFTKYVEATRPINPFVGAKQSAEVFVSLAGDERQARQQAIAVLLSSGYQDPEETRSFAILGRSPGVEYSQDELNKDVEKYPDFDIAYVRAAYPTRSEDHAHADISLFPEGLIRCKVKARLLARLCSYCTWKCEWLKALDCAVAAVLIGVPSEGPSDMVQVLEVLAAAFDQVGLHNDAHLARKVQAPYSLGPEETAAVERAVTALAGQHADDVRWAADTVREKLLQTAQAQR